MTYVCGSVPMSGCVTVELHAATGEPIGYGPFPVPVDEAGIWRADLCPNGGGSYYTVRSDDGTVLRFRIDYDPRVVADPESSVELDTQIADRYESHLAELRMIRALRAHALRAHALRAHALRAHALRAHAVDPRGQSPVDPRRAKYRLTLAGLVIGMLVGAAAGVVAMFSADPVNRLIGAVSLFVIVFCGAQVLAHVVQSRPKSERP